MGFVGLLLLASPAHGQGTTTSTTSTTIYDTGYCATPCAAPPNPGGTSAFTAIAGDSFYDTATVAPASSPTPTGTVAYSLSSASDCSGSALESLGTVTLNADGSVPNSLGTGPLAAGTYGLQATYSGDGNYAGSSDCESLTVGSVPSPAPTVSKTVTPSFSRTFSWEIFKSCAPVQGGTLDPKAPVLPPPPTPCSEGLDAFMNSVTVTYGVTADGTTVDSNFQTAATITVTNPSSLISFGGLSLTDSDSNGGTCAIATGSDGDSPAGPFTLTAGETETFGVTCTFSANPGSGSDTATLTFIGSDGLTHLWTTTNAPYDFSDVTPSMSGYATTTVTDTLDSTTTTLGTCSAPNPTGPLSTNDFYNQCIFSYGSTNPCPISATDCFFTGSIAALSTTFTYPSSCGSQVTDTATDVETDTTATATVSVSCTVSTTAFDTGYCNPTCAAAPPDSGGSSSFAALADDNFYDTATVTSTLVSSPEATGTLTYNLYPNGDCSGLTFTTLGTVTLASGSVPNSPGSGPLAAGTYGFQVAFTSGDTNYPSMTSFCEPLTVGAAPAPAPSVSKVVNPTFNRQITWALFKSCSPTLGGTLDPKAPVLPPPPAPPCLAGLAPTTPSVTITYGIEAVGTSLDTYTGTITLTNPYNSGSFTGLSLTDTDSNGGTCVIATGSVGDSPSGPFTLTAGETETFSVTCTFTETPSTGTDTAIGSDTATLAWSDTEGPFTFTGSDGLMHQTSTLAPGSAVAGAPYDFTGVTPNLSGDATVTVTDALNGVTTTLGTCSAPNPAGPLPVNYYFNQCNFSPTSTFTYPTSCGSQVTDTATLVETDTTATAMVGVTCPPTVSKTVSTSFTRTYNWGITKQCSFNDVTFTNNCQADVPGGSATVYYEVVATNTGYVDSSLVATGTITVANPNFFAVTNIAVSDNIGNGGSCGVSLISGGPFTSLVTVTSIAADGTVIVYYSCSFSSNPGSGTNTATASWAAQTCSYPSTEAECILSGSAQGTAPYSFSTPTTSVNAGVTVTDTYNGGSPTTLGTCYASGQGSPASPCTYTFSKTLTLPTDTCVSVTDSAGMVGSGGGVLGTAVSNAQACPKLSGFLAQGFWKGVAGQLIIALQTLKGVCPSASYLHQFAAFSDLGAASPCPTVALYVLGVMNAATCSSSSVTCNTMLKSQMLATALDVYFSGSTSTSCGAVECGGDVVALFNGGIKTFLGGVSIDLTNIGCAADGGYCTPGSSSSVFGGAVTMTVLNSLLYQNTVCTPNTGGFCPNVNTGAKAGLTSWYGQVKANQVLAKDVFDAINNNIAFA